MEKIMKIFGEVKENSDMKVNLAVKTYDMVDRHITRLDAKLARFEAEMRETGERVSQSESEDEEAQQENKVREEYFC